VRVHLRIEGRVQGVGFRYATRDQALRLGLGGWVRNRGAREVEVAAEGEQSAIEALVAWCRRGPPGAYVRDVSATWDQPTEGLVDFTIRETVD
jgi:acylphosphatase